MSDNEGVTTSGGVGFKSQKFVFGQRIGVSTDATETELINDLLDALATVPGDFTDILGSLFGSSDDASPSFGYDASAKWLAGVKLEGLGVLSITVLLVDPQFYGLRIEIGESKKENGGGEGENESDEESSDPLAGLVLEIIYRKINDTLGEFSGDLTLPDRYRTIQMPAPPPGTESPASTTITLPSVGLAIFTNGDFKVSIGWPLGDRSFNISFPPNPVPWAGGGGLYFAKLRSEDLSGALAKAHFDPIVEFGIGLRIGVASEGKVAVVKYKASLYLFGTFEGFLAWSEDRRVSGGIDYYWFCATVGITGHLEGSVDFVIISASLALDITVSVALALETGHATEAVARFEAKVTAKVKVLFITVHVSFHLDLKMQVGFGSGPPALVSGPTPPEASPEPPASLAAIATPATDYELADPPPPEPVRVPIPVHLLLQPGVRNAAASSSWQPQPIGVAGLFIPFTPPGAPDTGLRTAVGLGDDGFSTLVAGLASYVLTRFGGYTTGPLSTKSLDHARAALEAGELDLSELATWAKGYTFTVTPVDPASGDASEATTPVDGAAFPMIPGLTLTYEGTTTTFGDDPAPPGYLAVLERYLARLRMGEDPTGAVGARALAAAQSQPPPSWLPGVIFTDYFQMIATQMVADMGDIADGTSTLQEVLAQLPVANLAGVGSRFLLHGLRLPVPEDIQKPLPDMEQEGLYAMTGQQFDVSAGALSATFGTATVTTPFPVELVSNTAALPFALATAPSTDIPVWKPQATPRIVDHPLWVLLGQGISWTPSTGSTRMMFGLPEPLQDELAGAGTLSLALSRTTGGAADGSTAAVTPVTGMEGLLVRFSLEILPAASEAGVFGVKGTDDLTRGLLEQMFTRGETMAAELLVPKSGGGYTTAGASLILKTNLSTETQPDTTLLFARTAPTDELGPTSAPITEAASFLRILWECSVVHAGGFYLQVDGLKKDAFGGKDTLEVALLVTASGSTLPAAASDAKVAVDECHNVIVVDTSSDERVQAQVYEADGTTEVTRPRPNYPVGTATFGATWSDPPSDATAANTAAYANALYQFVQYRLAPSTAPDIEPSPWSLPLGPDGDATSWSYRRSVPVYKFVENPTNNVYAAVGSTPTVELQAVDLFGNASPLDPMDPPPQVVYNDRLVPPDEWPATRAVYRFVKKSAAEATLRLDFTFQADQIPEHLQASAKDQYTRILDQLTDPNTGLALTTAMADGPVTTGPADLKTALATLVRGIVAYLGGSGSAPTPTRLTGTVPTGWVKTGIDAEVFPVWATLTMTRAVPAESTPFDYPPGFVEATSPLSPDLDPKSAEASAAAEAGAPPALPSTGLLDWARDFEKAFEGFGGTPSLLKVLVGRPPAQVTSSRALLGRSAAAAVPSAPGDVWAVKWGADGIDVSFPNSGPGSGSGQPVYFAPLPLSTELLSGTVDVFDYGSDGQKSAVGTPTRFSGIDLDLWARQFLGALEGLFTAERAAALAQVDADGFGRLLSCKSQISEYISGTTGTAGIARVLAADEESQAGDLETAAEKFRASLLASLGNDYATSAIVQLGTVVSTTGTVEGGEAEPPRLFGNVAPSSRTLGPEQLDQYTISTTRLPIAAASDTLTFLAGAVHPTTRADLCIAAGYEIGFVEHRFDTVAEKYGYVPSSWLRFVSPGADPSGGPPVLRPAMGQLDIPIPLRSYPSAPRLVQQTAAPNWAAGEAPASVSEALRWRYEVAVSKPTAAQDSLHLTVEFNGVPDTPLTAPGTGGPDALFTALARFTAQFPKIPSAAISTTTPDAERWLTDVVELVESVAAGWRAHAEPGEAETLAAATGLPEPVVYDYIVTVPDETGLEIDVEWQGSSPPVFPTLAGKAPTSTSGTVARYQLDQAGDRVLALAWPGLEVISLQRATTSAFIRRNESLAGCGGTGASPQETNPDFVYTSPTVTFAAPAVPLLETPTPIEVRDPTSLSSSVDQLFQGLGLLAPAGASVTPTRVGLAVEVGYTFGLVQGATPAASLLTRQPVLLARADVSTSPTPPEQAPAAFGAELTRAIQAWRTSTAPPDTKDRFVSFSVSVYAASTQTAIARLGNVIAQVSGEGWWGTSPE